MYTIVSTFSKTFDDLGLVYYVPSFVLDEIKLGQIVEVPVKNSIELGVILKLSKSIEDLVNDYDISKIKSLISIKNSSSFIISYQFELIPWISNFYFSLIHNSLNLFFPKNLKDKITKDKIDLTKIIKTNYSYNNSIILNSLQEEAFNNIKDSKNNKILFYGLTGSGKTEIYINLIRDNLLLDKQSLLLVPEIILTNQIYNRIKNVFGEDVIIINSSISDAQKTKHWINIYNNNAKIIIGTRSALFYPYSNLGLIIIDEEHDDSYISNSSPRYNSIEVAEKISFLNNNKLILASGTPSIKSMYKGIKNEYKIVNLLEKFS